MKWRYCNTKVEDERLDRLYSLGSIKSTGCRVSLLFLWRFWMDLLWSVSGIVLLRLLHLLLTCISLGTIPRQEFAQKRWMFWFLPEVFLSFLEKTWNGRIRNGDSVLNDSLSMSGFMATPYEQLVRERWRHHNHITHFGNISSCILCMVQPTNQPTKVIIETNQRRTNASGSFMEVVCWRLEVL